VKALSDIAPHLSERVRCLPVFDPFRHGRQLQALCQIDDGSDNVALALTL